VCSLIVKSGLSHLYIGYTAGVHDKCPDQLTQYQQPTAYKMKVSGISEMIITSYM